MKATEMSDERIAVQFERRDPLVVISNLPMGDGSILTFCAISVQQAKELRDQLDEALRMA